MQNKRRKLTKNRWPTLMLALLLMLAPAAALVPVRASAGPAEDFAALKSTIEAITGGGGAACYSATINGTTMTVTGASGNVINPATANITIPDGYTVRWEATVTGSFSTVLNASGGTLEINCPVNSSVNTVIAQSTNVKIMAGANVVGNNKALQFNGGSFAMEGGTLKSTLPLTIQNATSANITGGAITSEGGAGVQKCIDTSSDISISNVSITGGQYGVQTSAEATVTFGSGISCTSTFLASLQNNGTAVLNATPVKQIEMRKGATVKNNTGGALMGTSIYCYSRGVLWAKQSPVYFPSNSRILKTVDMPVGSEWKLSDMPDAGSVATAQGASRDSDATATVKVGMAIPAKLYMLVQADGDQAPDQTQMLATQQIDIGSKWVASTNGTISLPVSGLADDSSCKAYIMAEYIGTDDSTAYGNIFPMTIPAYDPAAPAITGISASTATLNSAGGAVIVTVTADNVPDLSTVTFGFKINDGSIGIMGYYEADGTFSFNIDPNTTDNDKLYSYYASLDDGTTWSTETATTTLLKQSAGGGTQHGGGSIPQPTTRPTATPTASPTAKPTASPTITPTTKPTVQPTTKPTAQPTIAPSPTASPSPEPRQGWQKAEGPDARWQYMAGDKPITGWQQLDWNGATDWYYFDSAGNMQTGWAKVGGQWYYLTGSGAMSSGWVQDGDRWYYLNPGGGGLPEGAMHTGWVQDGGRWYYLNPGGGGLPEGAMHTGWVQDGDHWYYLNPGGNALPEGAMLTGWVQVEYMGRLRWFYLSPGGINGYQQGAMLTGTHIIDGKRYHFGSDGAMQ